MDVVKRNIAALNGTVEIDSAEGYGMKVSVRLPLTLAIMDGMSVGVSDEVYILPLSSVVESFQVNADDVSTVAQGSQLVKVREEGGAVALGRVLTLVISARNGVARRGSWQSRSTAPRSIRRRMRASPCSI